MDVVLHAVAEAALPVDAEVSVVDSEVEEVLLVAEASREAAAVEVAAALAADFK